MDICLQDKSVDKTFFNHKRLLVMLPDFFRSNQTKLLDLNTGFIRDTTKMNEWTLHDKGGSSRNNNRDCNKKLCRSLAPGDNYAGFACFFSACCLVYRIRSHGGGARHVHNSRIKLTSTKNIQITAVRTPRETPKVKI